MKKAYFDYMLVKMRDNENVYFILCGLGWPRLSEFLYEFPDRTINTEASEQTALDIAVGLAYEGKIPFVYTITPFFLRGFETLRTYINHEKLNVKLIGAGRDDDYSSTDGFSHDAKDIGDLLNPLSNILQYYPETIEDMQEDVDRMIRLQKPIFLSLKK